MSIGLAIPTLDYPSQTAAIIALYEERVEPRVIAQRTGASVNVVHRAIHDYRVKTGCDVSPIREKPRAVYLPSMANVWELDDHRRAQAFARRASAGAKATRMAQE